MFNNILKRNKEIVAYFGITEIKLMKVYIIKNKGYIYIKKFEIIKNDLKLKEKVDNNFLVYYEKRTKNYSSPVQNGNGNNGNYNQNVNNGNTIVNNELCYLLKSEENRNSFKFFKISYFKYKNIIRLYLEKIIIDKKTLSLLATIEDEEIRSSISYLYSLSDKG